MTLATMTAAGVIPFLAIAEVFRRAALGRRLERSMIRAESDISDRRHRRS